MVQSLQLSETLVHKVRQTGTADTFCPQSRSEARRLKRETVSISISLQQRFYTLETPRLQSAKLKLILVSPATVPRFVNALKTTTPYQFTIKSDRLTTVSRQRIAHLPGISPTFRWIHETVDDFQKKRRFRAKHPHQALRTPLAYCFLR